MKLYSFLIAVFLILPYAGASPKKGGGRVPEKYSALEETSAITTRIASPSELNSTSIKSTRVKESATPAAPAPVKKPVTLVADPKPETLPGNISEDSEPSESFDPVPSDQVALMVKRLKLVELIVSRHARAYDYRMMTIKDLETRLAQLEAKQQQKTKVPTGSSAIDEVSRVRETEPLPPPPEDASAVDSSDEAR